MLIYILTICHFLFPWSWFFCKYWYLSWSYAHLHKTFVRFSQEAKEYNFLVLFQQAHAHDVAWTSSRKNADGKINSLLTWWMFSGIVIIINPAKCPDNFSSGFARIARLAVLQKHVYHLFNLPDWEIWNCAKGETKMKSFISVRKKKKKKRSCICLVYILGNAQKVERLRLWSWLCFTKNFCYPKTGRVS